MEIIGIGIYAVIVIAICIGIALGDGTALHKLLWILAIVFFPCLGVIAWLIVGSRTKSMSA